MLIVRINYHWLLWCILFFIAVISHPGCYLLQLYFNIGLQHCIMCRYAIIHIRSVLIVENALVDAALSNKTYFILLTLMVEKAWHFQQKHIFVIWFLRNLETIVNPMYLVYSLPTCLPYHITITHLFPILHSLQININFILWNLDILTLHYLFVHMFHQKYSSSNEYLSDQMCRQ